MWCQFENEGTLVGLVDGVKVVLSDVDGVKVVLSDVSAVGGTFFSHTNVSINLKYFCLRQNTG